MRMEYGNYTYLISLVQQKGAKVDIWCNKVVLLLEKTFKSTYDQVPKVKIRDLDNETTNWPYNIKIQTS